jgi:NTP pyrophosphatase (non-canonical NTP hydrolase)|tara:strand:+ start:518 stop:865 length:348 start_codon:yes stop_codon:yes gene_type:complete
MDFGTYDIRARQTAVYKEVLAYAPFERILYTVLGLTGEAGELANKIKKILRKDESILPGLEVQEALAYELGDVLWYVNAVADEIGFTLDEIAKMNLEKLESRKEREVIKGDGDSR